MNRYVKANPELCMGCRTCLAGCAVAHAGEDFFYGNPDGFSFNPKLYMVKTTKLSTPIQCKHCESPACMAACVKGCIRIEDGAVILDQKNCIGCKDCMLACPFGAIAILPVSEDGKPLHQLGSALQKKAASKCDLCLDLAGGPACVRACPNQALRVVDPDEERLAKNLKAAESLVFQK